VFELAYSLSMVFVAVYGFPKCLASLAAYGNKADESKRWLRSETKYYVVSAASPARVIRILSSDTQATDEIASIEALRNTTAAEAGCDDIFVLSSSFTSSFMTSSELLTCRKLKGRGIDALDSNTRGLFFDPRFETYPLGQWDSSMQQDLFQITIGSYDKFQ
jgi:hypothetical protein